METTKAAREIENEEVLRSEIAATHSFSLIRPNPSSHRPLRPTGSPLYGTLVVL
jgi:hypothetical protein